MVCLVYDGGTTVRFAGRPADLTPASSAPLASPAPPHLIYLEQALDPVVWWSPQLVLQRPDWLREPRGRDVLPAIRWFPFVTFWQLTADLVHSRHLPSGHGHNYGTQAADAWAQLAPPPGWDPGRTAAVKAAAGTKR